MEEIEKYPYHRTAGKTDPNLGMEIEKYLVKKGKNTPLKKGYDFDSPEQKKKITEAFKTIMESLNLDLTDDSLIGTPDRVAKMYVDEIFYGLNPKNFPKVTTVENKFEYDNLVIERNINTQSNCEHHFVVIDGLTHIGYIPKKKVLGLSKLNRVVEYFAKRPQIQERIAEQIFHSLEYILGTSDIAVVTVGKHYCVKSRGIQDIMSDTVTSKLGGKFLEEPALRAEFMRMINV